MTAPSPTAAPAGPVEEHGRPGTPSWRADRAGLAAFAVLAAVLTAMSLLRWTNHWAGALDLGLFDQGVWLMSEGRAPELTVLPENLFGDHLSPVLVLFAPLYALHPSPAWLLVVQAIAVAATVMPMRTLARHFGLAPAWATVAVAGSSPLLMMNLYDFHPVALSAPLVGWGLVAAVRDDARTALWLTLGVGLVRADSAVLMLGAAVVAGPRARRAIVPAALGSMAVGMLVPALLHSEQTFERYYGGLGTGPFDAATHPWRVVTTLLGEQARRTAFVWLLPVGFLALLRPRWLLAVVVGGLPLLLSSKLDTSLPWFHHAGTVAPLVIGAALAGLAHATARFDRREEAGTSARPSIGGLVLRALLPLGIVAALFTKGPLTPDGPASQTLEAMSPRSTAGLQAALDAVDPDDRVAAESWIVVELARRPVVHPIWCDREPDDCAIPGPPGRDVDVVLARRSRTEVLESLGWRIDPTVPGDIIVARPPERP